MRDFLVFIHDVEITLTKVGAKRNRLPVTKRESYPPDHQTTDNTAKISIIFNKS